MDRGLNYGKAKSPLSLKFRFTDTGCGNKCLVLFELNEHFSPFLIPLVGIHAQSLPSLLVHIRSYPGSHGPESHSPDERWTREGKGWCLQGHVQYVSAAGENADLYGPSRPELEQAAVDLASMRAAAAVFPDVRRDFQAMHAEARRM